MHDRFKKRFRAPKGDDRVRGQIAREAARRMLGVLGPADASGHLRESSDDEYYTAKRKAAAVLGHRVRPGDLPSDAEVRAAVLDLLRTPEPTAGPAPCEPDSAAEASGEMLADHVDRFTIYKLRLEPLAQVKQNPKTHPEGDALYHSLQVFERAREACPYDEEFLIAALLHDVGKAIDPRDHVIAGLAALEGTITERTAWLIAHHHDLSPRSNRPLGPRARRAIDESPHREDLELLSVADAAGCVPGAVVGTVDEALEYLRGLETEAYLTAESGAGDPP